MYRNADILNAAITINGKPALKPKDEPEKSFDEECESYGYEPNPSDPDGEGN